MSKERLVHHIALGTPRVEFLAQFYEEALGLERLAVHFDEDNTLRSIWLHAGHTVIMVERSAEPIKTDGSPVRPGWASVMFDAGADRIGLCQSVAAAGGHPDGQTDATSYFRDPDGHRFGVSSFAFEF